MCSAQYIGSSHAFAHAILKFNTHQMHVQCNGSHMGRLRYNCNGSHLVYLCRDRISAASVNHVRGKCDPGRTRTCNLWFRRPTPYPLGHRAACRPGCRRQAVMTRNLDQSRAPTLRNVAPSLHPSRKVYGIRAVPLIPGFCVLRRTDRAHA